MTDNLAAKIKNGDQKAFELFYIAEFDNLVFFLERYLNDYCAAEDIASESLWVLWERRETIDPERNIRALVFTTARNRAVNQLKSKYHSTRSLDRDRISADIYALQDNSFSGWVDTLSLEELIEKVYSSLPASSRESFILSRKQGLTNREIAERKQITVKAVEYHIKISLKIFRDQLKEYLTLF